MSEWRVEVIWQTPEPVDDDALRELAEAADTEHEWFVSAWPDGDGVEVASYVEATSAVAAAEEFTTLLQKWMAGPWAAGSVASTRAMTEDVFERESTKPNLPKLAGAADAAEMLGVSRQRIHQLAQKHPRFPAPVDHVSGGPVWTEEAIEWFDSVWDRKPGRPHAAITGAVSGGLADRPSGGVVHGFVRAVPPVAGDAAARRRSSSAR
jgi:hypothetical protein